MLKITDTYKYAEHNVSTTPGAAGGVLGTTLIGRQVYDSGKGYRQVDVHPKQHRVNVASVAPQIQGKYWNRVSNRMQYGWKFHEYRSPDLFHEPVANELKQFSWKNKVAEVFKHADLTGRSNPWVPKPHATGPFIPPGADYIPRGAQIPRVVDAEIGEGGEFKPDQNGSMASVVNNPDKSSATISRAPSGGWAPEVAGSVFSYRKRRNKRRGAGMGRMHGGGGDDDDDDDTMDDDPMQGVVSTPQGVDVVPFIAAIQQSNQSLRQAILDAQQNATVQQDSRLTPVLAGMVESINNLSSTVNNLGGVVQTGNVNNQIMGQRGLEYMERIGSAVVSLQERTQAIQNAPHSSQVLLGAITQQMNDFKEQQARVMELIQQQNAGFSERYANQQQQLLEGLSKTIKVIEQGNQARPQEIVAATERASQQIANANMLISQQIKELSNTSGAATAQLALRQEELSKMIAGVQANMSQIPAAQQPQLQAIMDAATSTQESVNRLNSAIEASRAKAPAIEYDDGMDASLDDDDDDASGGGMSVSAPGYNEGQVMTVEHPTPKLLTFPTATPPQFPTLTGLPTLPPPKGLMGKEPRKVDQHNKAPPMTAQPVVTAPPKPRKDTTAQPVYRQFPYPKEGKKPAGFDPSRRLLDQDEKFFQSNDVRKHWKQIEPYLGKENRKLYLAIHQARRGLNKQESLQRLRTRVTKSAKQKNSKENMSARKIQTKVKGGPLRSKARPMRPVNGRASAVYMEEDDDL